MWARWENMGTVDRIIRLALGVIFMVIGLLAMTTLIAVGAIFILIGAILLISGGTGFCPAYRATNYNTLDKGDIDDYPSWRHHHSRVELPRHDRYATRKRSFGGVGRGHQSGMTREWVWKQGEGTHVRARGVYHSGHSARRSVRNRW